MKTIITKMKPEDEATYAVMKLLAPKPVLELARDLQRCAFQGRRDFDGDFDPSPIYLHQAFSMWENRTTRQKILTAINNLKS